MRRKQITVEDIDIKINAKIWKNEDNFFKAWERYKEIKYFSQKKFKFLSNSEWLSFVPTARNLIKIIESKNVNWRYKLKGKENMITKHT